MLTTASRLSCLWAKWGALKIWLLGVYTNAQRSLSLFFCRLTERFPLAALGGAKDTNYNNRKKKTETFKKELFWQAISGSLQACLLIPKTSGNRKEDCARSCSNEYCSYSFPSPLMPSLPSCRTSRLLKSFLPSSVALFNSLPISVVCCSSKRSFLQAVDKFFLPDMFSRRFYYWSQLFSHTFFPQGKLSY